MHVANHVTRGSVLEGENVVMKVAPGQPSAGTRKCPVSRKCVTPEVALQIPSAVFHESQLNSISVV